MHPYDHYGIIHSGQHVEATTVPFDRWLDKEDGGRVHNGTPLSHKNRWNTAVPDNVDGPWEYYAGENKSVRKS